MKKLYLIYGGSGSGKSEVAEKYATLSWKNKGNIYYLATMKVYGEEGKKRVERHIKLREGKGFITVEKETNIAELKLKDTVLLECMSNLVANEMFMEDGIIPKDVVIKNILRGIDSIKNSTENLIIVTNNVFDDGTDYDLITLDYMNALAEINKHLAKIADKVIEVVAGIEIEVS